MYLTSKLSNLVSPASEAFTPDELSVIVGTCLPDAVAVLDSDGTTILGGNERLEELLGFEIGEGSGDGYRSFDEFVHADDRELFRTCVLEGFTRIDGVVELRLVSVSRPELPAEVHLTNFRWKRREYLVAFVRPISDQEGVETELKRKIEEQKRKTLEAIESSLLIYQFTEKIKKTPALTANLLSMENEAQLFERASKILAGDGLNYKDVTFFLVVGDALEVCHSTKASSPEPVSLDEKNRYARFIRDGHARLRSFDSGTLVPLKSRGKMLGLIEVTMHPREQIFFDGLNLISGWQKDALLTIGDMIALLLDNLRLYRQVEQKSITDTLTGVHNRHYFMSRLSEETSRCMRHGHPISLIFIDVDEFKTINDNYGHLQGDEVLRRLGKVFRNNVREYDVVCRYGGDEFVILLPELTGEEARLTGEKLLEKVREEELMTCEEPRRRIPVSISLGVSEMTDETSEDRFLKAADDALYMAKGQGRNRLAFNQA